ncbi:MAG: hypothetical protein M2R45_00915 [Verrucomicrobia subdivision 3 bacterium]|nr:hypothetical protein [Limisphaerales bacterium]MCS1414584.1 hypothetical protein [Limisphaerales bacterium]
MDDVGIFVSKGTISLRRWLMLWMSKTVIQTVGSRRRLFEEPERCRVAARL